MVVTTKGMVEVVRTVVVVSGTVVVFFTVVVVFTVAQGAVFVAVLVTHLVLTSGCTNSRHATLISAQL